MPSSVHRSGRANESVTRVLHTERPKTLPSIGLWVTTPLKRLLQLLLHRPLPAAAALGRRLSGRLCPTDTPGVPSDCPRLEKRKLLQCQCPPLPVSPQLGTPGVTLGFGAQCQDWTDPCVLWGQAGPLSVAGLRPYPGWAPDPFLSLVFNLLPRRRADPAGKRCFLE